MTDASTDNSRPTAAPSKEGRDRRREILEVAARLFSEQGYHGTSMDDIAREMGMLKGSLYYWISSKEDLLKAILADAITDTIADAERIEASDLPAAEKVRQLFKAHIESWIRNPHNFNVFLYETRFLDKETLRDLGRARVGLEVVYRRIFQNAAAIGELRLKEEDVVLAVNSVFGMLNWFPRWYRAKGWASSDYIAELMADMVLNGLDPLAKATSD